MKPNLALFDFDGTITRKDTLFEFIIFVHGKASFYGWMVLLFPWLALLKLKLVSAQSVKEMLLRRAIGNLSLEQFASLCDEFCEKRLPQLLRHEAILAFNAHIKNGDKVVIVSASPENWIHPWARLTSTKVISTRLKVIDGFVSGKIDGKNCNGPEKVVRIKQEFSLEEFEKIYAYGDSTGDKELLALADFPFYRRFS